MEFAVTEKQRPDQLLDASCLNSCDVELLNRSGPWTRGGRDDFEVQVILTIAGRNWLQGANCAGGVHENSIVCCTHFQETLNKLVILVV